MNEQQALVWAAGVIDGNAKIHINEKVNQLNRNKKHFEVSIEVFPGRPSTLERLKFALNNGSINGQLFYFSGVAAFRGAVESLWPYLTIDTKREINKVLQRIKAARPE